VSGPADGAAVRVAGTAPGPGAFEVASATDPAHRWVVEWRSPAAHWCGCPRFARAGRCRHVRLVFEAIRAEYAALRASGALRPRPATEVGV
jgi:hypothetical protein